jgi:hypothetical protein
MPKMQIRARTLQPGGTLVHDVFAPKDSPWRVSAEFFLVLLAGDYYFSDMGNEDDWLLFCADVAKHEKPDNFDIIEKALLFYAETPTDNGYNPPGPNPTLEWDGGAKAREALEALDRLIDEYAERSANALQEARDMIRRDDCD